jgi:hypothetical protein
MLLVNVKLSHSLRYDGVLAAECGLGGRQEGLGFRAVKELRD